MREVQVQVSRATFFKIIYQISWLRYVCLIHSLVRVINYIQESNKLTMYMVLALLCIKLEY